MAKIIVDIDKCIGCGNCVNICPAGVYEIKNGKSVPIRMDECLLCHACQAKCPRHAIQVTGHMSLVQHVRARGTFLRKVLSSKPPNRDNKTK